MTFTRRTILRGGLAMGAMTALPRLSFAAQTLEMGSARLDTLSDGNLVLPLSFVSDNPDAKPILESYGITGDSVEPPCNVTLYRDGTNTVLFDVGSGNDFMPSAGKLMEAMDALEVAPDDVTHVVFTHGHPDHLWGVLDDFDEPFFANAQHMMGKDEFEYWLNPETLDTIDDGRKTFAAGALRRLEILEDQIDTFGDGAEILPGIMAQMTPGHTPGHMSFHVKNGNTQAFIIGDAIVNHYLAFAAPGMEAGSDQNPELGAKTRVALLDQLATDNLPIIGYHLPEGGLGRVERDGDAYRYVAEV
ncbi:MBL fold metallo-hydrolase [Thioclava sp. F28-4]|uniref:MBL fold metallo-hydrolase n=1 Tax=Thioclava sp. F28-4 TaxID=1915315 RepID=UPI0009983CDA|nr:MBL fold metallo-hydrolase [Thioclava sp. F28-4]OOY04987.1 MBL fold metallo-hydrolase [Thioclava sp. F28-4]